MQTFIVDRDMRRSASYLDNKRLGKQRVEAIQIARLLLGISEGNGWENHPAAKMWKGHETFLIRKYLRAVLDEWADRGFRNDKCEAHYDELSLRVKGKATIRPPWIEKVIESHRSNLIRKSPGHYRKFWPSVSHNLPYVWPF